MVFFVECTTVILVDAGSAVWWGYDGNVSAISTPGGVLRSKHINQEYGHCGSAI
jgi:hypothetical protein